MNHLTIQFLLAISFSISSFERFINSFSHVTIVVYLPVLSTPITFQTFYDKINLSLNLIYFVKSLFFILKIKLPSTVDIIAP